MRVAVAGCGWSGSLLAYKLSQQGYAVEVYERNKKPTAVCACGIPASFFIELAKSCSLNPEDYICQKGDLVIALGKKRFHLKAGNLCTFNKQKFMEDLINQTLATFHFGRKFALDKAEEYNLIIDATGTRELLGRLPQDQFFVTYQVKAKFANPPYHDFYFQLSQNPDERYLWYFPLSEKEAYVGFGSKNGQSARQHVESFLKHHKAQPLQRQAKILRLNPPQESLPFSIGKILGVGNSIGAITSMGEGNAPSAMTVQILTENLYNPQRYTMQVLKKLGWLKHDHAAYKAWNRKQKMRTLYHMLRILKTYRERFKLTLPVAMLWWLLVLL